MWLCDEMQLRLVWSLSDCGMNVQSVDSGASEAGSVGGRFVNHSSINASLASIHLCTPVRGECAGGLHLRETIAGIGGGFSSLRTLTRVKRTPESMHVCLSVDEVLRLIAQGQWESQDSFGNPIS